MLNIIGIHASTLANGIFLVVLVVSSVGAFFWGATGGLRREREWNQVVRKLNAEAIARRPTCDKCGGSGRLSNGLYVCGRCNGTGKMLPERYR